LGDARKAVGMMFVRFLFGSLLAAPACAGAAFFGAPSWVTFLVGLYIVASIVSGASDDE
jgi:hypothetical protein